MKTSDKETSGVQYRLASTRRVRESLLREWLKPTGIVALIALGTLFINALNYRHQADEDRMELKRIESKVATMLDQAEAAKSRAEAKTWEELVTTASSLANHLNAENTKNALLLTEVIKAVTLKEDSLKLVTTQYDAMVAKVRALPDQPIHITPSKKESMAIPISYRMMKHGDFKKDWVNGDVCQVADWF
ncbi:MAG: hypothetical protein ACO1TE_12450 [Prosthecobacter sp.]